MLKFKFAGKYFYMLQTDVLNHPMLSSFLIMVKHYADAMNAEEDSALEQFYNETNNLAEVIYEEHFQDKRNNLELAFFICHLITQFRNNAEENAEEK